MIRIQIALFTLMISGLTSVVRADATRHDPAVQTLMHRIDAIEHDIAELRDGTPPPPRAREVLTRRIIDEIDARREAGLDGFTTGYKSGFVIQSEDSNFKLRVKGRVQLRYIASERDVDPGGDSSRRGFEARRVRIELDGHVFDPSWKWKVVGDPSRSTGTLSLNDAWIQKSFDNGFSVLLGRFRPSLFREYEVSSKRQLAVERSLVVGEFNFDRGSGVGAAYSNDDIKVKIAYVEDFIIDPAVRATRDRDWVATTRIEWRVAGDWKRFRDHTSSEGETAILIGGGIGYEQNDDNGPGGAMMRSDSWSWTVDVSAEKEHYNAFAAIIGRHTDPETGENVDVIGIVAQAGMRISENDEIFIRYEWGDDDRTEQLRVLTAGMNRYIYGHGVKITGDVGYAFDEVSSTWASSGAGWVADDAGQDGQVVVRGQLQLTF
ncbi:MAG: porin [Planctomycetota bacterium]